MDVNNLQKLGMLFGAAALIISLYAYMQRSQLVVSQNTKKFIEAPK